MSHDDARSFEDIKTRLDEIVSLVSDDSLPLDEALDLYEEAVGIGLQASRIMEEGIAEKEAEQAAQALLDAIPSETKADFESLAESSSEEKSLDSNQ
ncbi:MAG: exodeoxyribonuclease VII small subunit [Eggerthellaceae bacterium]|nr:exodeoxyribonuclease VII small subunit [Eggerthellaceae bacterium]